MAEEGGWRQLSVVDRCKLISNLVKARLQQSVQQRAAPVLERLQRTVKPYLPDRHRREVGVRFLRPHLPYNMGQVAVFQVQYAARLVREGVATYAPPYPGAKELLRDKWQRVRTAPGRLRARLRGWYEGELIEVPPGVVVIPAPRRRPWLALKIDATIQWLRNQAPRSAAEMIKLVVAGALGALLGGLLLVWVLERW